MLNAVPSPPQRYSNGPSSSSSSSLANQQLPATCGARQLSKLKRFLTTLQQFGNDISPEIGDSVRSLVLALVVNPLMLKTSTGSWGYFVEFHLITAFVHFAFLSELNCYHWGVSLTASGGHQLPPAALCYSFSQGKHAFPLLTFLLDYFQVLQAAALLYFPVK